MGSLGESIPPGLGSAPESVLEGIGELRQELVLSRRVSWGCRMTHGPSDGMPHASLCSRLGYRSALPGWEGQTVNIQPAEKSKFCKVLVGGQQWVILSKEVTMSEQRPGGSEG